MQNMASMSKRVNSRDNSAHTVRDLTKTVIQGSRRMTAGPKKGKKCVKTYIGDCCKTVKIQ